MVRGPRATLRSDGDPALGALLPADREDRHQPRSSPRLHPPVYRLTGGRWLVGPEPRGAQRRSLDHRPGATDRQGARDPAVRVRGRRPRLVVIGSQNGADREPGLGRQPARATRTRSVPRRAARCATSAPARPTARSATGCGRWPSTGYPGYELYAALDRPPDPGRRPRARGGRLMPAPLGKMPTKKMPNIQVFGLEDYNATRAALRFFRERRIVVHYRGPAQEADRGRRAAPVHRTGWARRRSSTPRAAPTGSRASPTSRRTPPGSRAGCSRTSGCIRLPARPLRRRGHGRQGRGDLEGLAGEAEVGRTAPAAISCSAASGRRPGP